MKINKIHIENFKIFKNISVELNARINLFIGENDSGKSSLLEAIILLLTGRYHGIPIANALNINWFNRDSRLSFIRDLDRCLEVDFPKIIFEAYFSLDDGDDFKLKDFRGTNNSSRSDEYGIRIALEFDNTYSELYKEDKSKDIIKDIPLEYYKVSIKSFSGNVISLNGITRKLAVIDTNRIDYGYAVNRFVSDSVTQYLSDEETLLVKTAYRKNRKTFLSDSAIKGVNQRLKENLIFKENDISINVKDASGDDWKRLLEIAVNDIPMDSWGLGKQKILKTDIFLSQNKDINFLAVEEPENNLSHTNLGILVGLMSSNHADKQLFLTTHSSFIVNKLELKNAFLLKGGAVESFSRLEKDTYNYFVKLPGYNTLRFILSNKVILVEGAADELILQRAYEDLLGKQPMKDGVDIISVESLAFMRYCEIARILNKKIVIVTDNDGNPKKVKEKYKDFEDICVLCVEQDERLNTLEPSVLNVNLENIDSFEKIITRKAIKIQKDETKGSAIKRFMINNKTNWAMRVLASENKINYPEYIVLAVNEVSKL